MNSALCPIALSRRVVALILQEESGVIEKTPTLHHFRQRAYFIVLIEVNTIRRGISLRLSSTWSSSLLIFEIVATASDSL